MGGARLRLREAFGRCRPVGTLPEHRAVAVAVRLKRDILTVWRPDRKPVPPHKRQLAWRARPGDRVDPDVGLSTVIGSKCHLFAVRRHAGELVLAGWQLERLHLSISIDKHEVP